MNAKTAGKMNIFKFWETSCIRSESGDCRIPLTRWIAFMKNQQKLTYPYVTGHGATFLCIVRHYMIGNRKLNDRPPRPHSSACVSVQRRLFGAEYLREHGEAMSCRMCHVRAANEALKKKLKVI
mgnify:CR=1 FL=1|jgi:hypothetical protein